MSNICSIIPQACANDEHWLIALVIVRSYTNIYHKSIVVVKCQHCSGYAKF